eukprot:101163-Rhodomonas_salina.2
MVGVGFRLGVECPSSEVLAIDGLFARRGLKQRCSGAADSEAKVKTVAAASESDTDAAARMLAVMVSPTEMVKAATCRPQRATLGSSHWVELQVPRFRGVTLLLCHGGSGSSA